MDLSSVQEQIHEQAKSHLAEFANALGVAEENQYLIFGRPESEIQRVAEAKGADVIIVGSHGRHGLALLLGSTANGVLHGATCDVLAVRVGDQQDQPDPDES
jgi:universal stress protein A